MRAANLTLRFLLELAALAALAWWGAATPSSTVLKVVLAVAAPLAAALLWGAFVAPKRRYDLSPAWRMAVEAVVFFAAALALAWIGRDALGLALLAVWIANRAMLAVAGES